MKPLCITATLQGPIASTGIHLDALLAYAVFLRDGIDPATTPEEIVPIEIPLEREPGGRFHLCSSSTGEWERMERKHIVRRFPLELAQGMGRDIRSVTLSGGAHRLYYYPIELGHLESDTLTWWAIGDADEVRQLLALISHLGKRRAAGLGRVREWSVEECEPWGHGFPVLGPEGEVLRHLPADWPDVGPHTRRYGRITYPYHHLGGAEVEVLAPC